MKKSFICVSFLCLLFLSSCPKDLSVVGATIEGHTYGNNLFGGGTISAVPGVPVKLIKNSVDYMQTISDESAYYIFSPIPAGTYDVQATFTTANWSSLTDPNLQGWGMFSYASVDLNGSADTGNFSYTGDILSGPDVVITRTNLTVAIGDSYTMNFVINGY